MKSKAKKMMQREDVRPHRPVDLRKSRWIRGDIVEVFYQNLWRPGKIMNALKNDYFVIRLTCFIQLKEFHISCLRVPHVNHDKQSTVLYKGFQGFEEDHHRTKRHKSSKLCPATDPRVVKKLKARRTLSDNFIRVLSKKSETVAYGVHQPIKKVLPLKDSSRNNIDGACFYGPLSDKHNDLSKKSFTRTKPECEVISSSQKLLHAKEDNECSVASCSVNCLDYSIDGEQQSVDPSSCFPDDALSTCPIRSWREDNNIYGPSLDMNLHDIELHAYQSTVRAFYASGPLTWEQESLLTNLRISLNISNEEHLLQLRVLLSS